jgi:hypothetical protein
VIAACDAGQLAEDVAPALDAQIADALDRVAARVAAPTVEA